MDFLRRAKDESVCWSKVRAASATSRADFPLLTGQIVSRRVLTQSRKWVNSEMYIWLRFMLSGIDRRSTLFFRTSIHESEKFHEWQASLEIAPAIASLRARAEEIRAAELRKAEGLLGKLDESQRSAVEAMTAQIVNKLLHLPTVRMKQAAAAADGVIYADAVRHLFGLGEDER